jgi:hypothetical protein
VILGKALWLRPPVELILRKHHDVAAVILENGFDNPGRTICGRLHQVSASGLELLVDLLAIVGFLRTDADLISSSVYAKILAQMY